MWGWRSPAYITNGNIFIFLYKRNLTSTKWKLLFFGTDNFSLFSLKALHKEFLNGKIIDKLEVVTNINNPPNAVLKFSMKNNLLTHPWTKAPPINNYFDLGIVVSFGHLIPKNIINSFPMGILNVHASLLPRWRGAAPIIHCLLHGDTQTGISIMKIQPHRFDIGDVIYQEKIDISSDILQPELYSQLADIGSKSLVKCLYNLPDCLNDATPQDNKAATFAPKVTQSLSKINWNESAKRIYDLSRALNGIHALESQYKNNIVKLKRLHLWIDDSCPNDKTMHPPGYFKYYNEKRVVRVWCKDNSSIFFDSIKIVGKSEMSATDFRNGYMKNVSEENLFFMSLE